MTEIREIPIQFPTDPVQCELIATLLSDKGFQELSRQIRVALKDQVKPTIDEPTEFGSVVRATCGPGLVGLLWQKSPMQGKHYWESETGAVEVWPELTDVEVLRIGVGGEYNQLLQQMRDILLRSPSGYLTNDETLAAYKDLRKSLSALLEDS